MTKTVVLGDEFDDALRARLLGKLKYLGGIPMGADWAMAGSQEIDTLKVRLEGGDIDVESETFVGLSITGPDKLVDEIAASMAT